MITLAMLFASVQLFGQKQITVAQDGSGNFKSIQEAINSISNDNNNEAVILIRKGTYNEKLFIDKNFITLKGEDPATTIVTISLAREAWRCSNPDDYGTATINLKGSDLRLENLSFINSYGKDNPAAQSINCVGDSGRSKVVSIIGPFGNTLLLRIP